LTDLWLGIVAGLAATPHCAGMCGAFPVHLSASGRGRPLARHLLYLAGKALTYAFIGAIAGMLGHWVTRTSAAVRYQNLFTYVLGGAMMLFGLTMLGAFSRIRLPIRGVQETGLFRDVYATFFQSPGRAAALLLGAATGFLPCPITLSWAAVAAATHSVARGMLAMVGLSVGTSAVLLFMGLSGTILDTRVRRIGLRGAGLIVLCLGLITMLRPSPVLHRYLPHLGGADTCCQAPN